MKILLVLNKPNREVPIMESIRREILLLDPHATIEIREMCVPGFTKFVFRYKPNVILTFPFTCEGFARWYYLFKCFLGAKIVSLRAEGVVDFSTEYNVQWAVGFDSYGKFLVDYELFWGEKLAGVVGMQLLKQRKLSSIDRVKVVGYSRLESYFSEKSGEGKPLPARIKEKLSSYEKASVVFLITGFHLANYTAKDLHDAKDLDAQNNLAELLEAVEITKRFRALWIQNVITAACENPQALFVIKKHPIERKEDYDAFDRIENILFIHEDIQVHEIIPYAGVFFHYGSTALVDAYLAGIPAIYVYSKDNGKWYSDLGWPSTQKIEVHEIPETVKRFLSGGSIPSNNGDIQRVLKEIFNIEMGKPYSPSRDIANILLDPSPPQSIPFSDRHFWRALASVSLDLAVGRFGSHHNGAATEGERR